MHYKLLGTSGLRVSPLCLGTMTFGEGGSGWSAKKPESKRMFETFVEAGGNFIDTANVYTYGVSEEYVGEFIKGDRDRFVIASKYSLTMQEGDPNAAGNQRKNMMRCIDDTLERLGTDHLDLYWVHAWDRRTPVAEVMRGLDDLVRSGKVHHVGISDAPAWYVAQANMLATMRGWSPFVAYQGQWSLASRGIERDVVPMARDGGMAVTPWGCLAGGILTGKYGKLRRDDEARRHDKSGWPVTDQAVQIGDEVVRIAQELDVPPAQVALAWLLAQGADVFPILGGRTADQIQDNLAALDLRLTDAHQAALEEVSALKPEFPHNFGSGEHGKRMLQAGTDIA